jgi:hypothetical protein
MRSDWRGHSFHKVAEFAIEAPLVWSVIALRLPNIPIELTGPFVARLTERTVRVE